MDELTGYQVISSIECSATSRDRRPRLSGSHCGFETESIRAYSFNDIFFLSKISNLGGQTRASVPTLGILLI